jgi:hypothetical protein
MSTMTMSLSVRCHDDPVTHHRVECLLAHVRRDMENRRIDQDEQREYARQGDVETVFPAGRDQRVRATRPTNTGEGSGESIHSGGPRFGAIKYA